MLKQVGDIIESRSQSNQDNNIERITNYGCPDSLFPIQNSNRLIPKELYLPIILNSYFLKRRKKTLGKINGSLHRVLGSPAIETLFATPANIKNSMNARP